MAHIGALLTWFELCVAMRLTAAGKRLSHWGKRWAESALRRFGHFSVKLRGEK